MNKQDNFSIEDLSQATIYLDEDEAEVQQKRDEFINSMVSKIYQNKDNYLYFDSYTRAMQILKDTSEIPSFTKADFINYLSDFKYLQLENNEIKENQIGIYLIKDDKEHLLSGSKDGDIVEDDSLSMLDDISNNDKVSIKAINIKYPRIKWDDKIRYPFDGMNIEIHYIYQDGVFEMIVRDVEDE